ncbi:MAG: class I SAM-dependent methyltransferase [Syntrophales bacterium]|nr:class I SAM-dependent methyltransferase [Syntrophales bacterium]MDD5533562.1 class I SAM-dependent methyltransferase [Syntrophales bacterium]
MKTGFLGRGMDRIPDMAFRVMSWIFVVRDRFRTPWALLDRFGIEKGQTVVDYGCGPGSYLGRASELAGPGGKVLAVDIHDLAIEAVGRRIIRERLSNVTAVKAGPGSSPIPDQTADVIYALDMFHMVSDAPVFLRELNRICRNAGLLFIDNGHQSREKARSKIISSGMWRIVEENKRYLKCTPLGKKLH